MAIETPLHSPTSFRVPTDPIWPLRIEQYHPSGPTDHPTYQQHLDYRPGETIPVLLDDHVIGGLSVADLLP